MLQYRPGFKASAAADTVGHNLPMTIVRSYSKADPGYARVVVSVTHRGESRNNKDIVFSAIANALDHKATPVPGTWMSTNQTTVSEDLIGMMACNQQVIAYNPEMESKFRAISSNMFMDEEKNMWTLKETDGGKLWVKTTAYDDEKVLEELLSSMSSANSSRFDYHQNSPDAEFRCKVEGGDYVAYVSKSNNADSTVTSGFSTGFVVTTVQDKDGKLQREVVIQGRGKDNYEIVDRNMLLSICSSDDTQSLKMAASADGDQSALTSTASSLRSNVSLEDILAYYRTLFSRNADYFAQFEQRIRSRFYG